MLNTLTLSSSTPSSGINPTESNALESNSAGDKPTEPGAFQKIMTNTSIRASVEGNPSNAQGIDEDELKRQESATLDASLSVAVPASHLMSNASTEDQSALTASSLITGVELRAPMDGDVLAVSGLKSTALSNRMTLITSERQAPDELSLGDFARQQGIDEKTLRWLMAGAPSHSSEIVQVTAQPEVDTGSATAPHSTSLADVDAQASLWTITAQVQESGDVSPSSGGDTSDSSLLPTPSSLLSPTWPTPRPVIGDTAIASMTTTTNGTGHPELRLWGLNTLTDAVKQMAKNSISGSQDVSNDAQWLSSVNVSALPTDASYVQQQKQMSQTDLDLTQWVGKDMSIWLKVLGQIKNNTEAYSSTDGLLKNRILENDDAVNSGLNATSGGGQNDGGPAGLAGALPAETKPAAVKEPQRDWVSHRPTVMSGQELADKMSTAIGKRLLEAFEKGDWQMKINLKPVELGHIEVDLKMRGSSLEAHFSAAQAYTRDLLESGMGRLKETLLQSGMDVASIKVNDGQSSRSGGDSTPRQPQTAWGGEVRGAEGKSKTEPQLNGPVIGNPDGSLDLMV